MNDTIKITGAREHNLKNLNLEIPKNKLVVFTGLSGSGKSTLAFDTLYAEGQRRYMESLSSYARQFLDRVGKPDVDKIEGLTRDRSKNHVQKPALDRGHDNGNLRLSAPSLCKGRHTALPQVRQTDL